MSTLGEAVIRRAGLRLVAGVMLVSIAVAAPAEAVGTQPPGTPQFERRVEELRRSRRFQTTLPGEGAPRAVVPESAPAEPMTRVPSRERDDAVMWVLLVVLGAVVLVPVLRALLAWLEERRGRPAGKAKPAPTRAVERGVAGDPSGAGGLGPAESLARRGEYAEALHALLLEALEGFQAHRGQALPRARTCREVLRDPALPEAGRTSLRALVARAEAVIFADQEVHEAEWRAAHEEHRRFLAALREAGAAR